MCCYLLLLAAAAAAAADFGLRSVVWITGLSWLQYICTARGVVWAADTFDSWDNQVDHTWNAPRAPTRAIVVVASGLVWQRKVRARSTASSRTR